MFGLFDMLSNILLALTTAGVTGAAFVLAMGLCSTIRKQVVQTHALRCAKQTCFVHRRLGHS